MKYGALGCLGLHVSVSILQKGPSRSETEDLNNDNSLDIDAFVNTTSVSNDKTWIRSFWGPSFGYRRMG